ncbi:PAS domain-containing protein [Haladaptatus sp. NG-SE-30]
MTSEGITRARVLAAITATEVMHEPVTASEVAETLRCSRQRVSKALHKLAEQGQVYTKMVGAQIRVWWVAPTLSAHTESDQERAGNLPLSAQLPDTTPIGVAMFTPEGTLCHVNDRAKTLLGIADDREMKATAFDRPVYDSDGTLLPPEQLPLARAARTDEPVFAQEVQVETPAGYRRWLSVNGTLGFTDNEGSEQVLIVVQDITKHKARINQLEQQRERLESELRTEKEHFRVALANSPLVAFRLDTNLRYTWIGNPHEDFEEVDVLGKRDDELLPPDAAETIMAPKREALETGERVREEVTYELPSGLVSYDLTVEPLRDESGEIVGLTSASLDITERMRHERKLEETVGKLEQANERLDSFASMLAHELRNPVAIGQMYCYELPDDVDPEVVEYITEAFDRIEDMIDIMLVVTQGRAAVGERQSVQLTNAVEAAWDSIDTDDATLSANIDVTIQADGTYIWHLFRNLFENAIEHGGSDVTVEVGELPTGFYVADDGSGIPAENRETVFEVGYTSAAEYGGTGLGLAFVREITKVYDWECTITESASGGARFEFKDVR